MYNKLKLAGISVSAALFMTGAALANPYEEYAGTTLIVNFPAHPALQCGHEDPAGIYGRDRH